MKNKTSKYDLGLLTQETLKSDLRIIADQINNNEMDSDEEMINFLTEQTSIEKETISKIVLTERPKSFTNPFHEIDFTDYGFSISNPNR